MAVLSVNPKFTVIDSNGDPVVGGKVYTYVAGTTTPKATYTDSTEGTANANPVILDSSGRADIWLLTDELYKIRVDNSDDTTLYTIDNVRGFTGGNTLVADTSPQLSADLDCSGYNIQFDDATGIEDDSGNEQLRFQKTASAVNYIEITNAAASSGPTITTNGGDTNIDLNINPKGTGEVTLSGTLNVTDIDILKCVLLEKKTISAGTSATFTTGLTSTYTGFILLTTDLIMPTGGINLYFSDDAGSTWFETDEYYILGQKITSSPSADSVVFAADAASSFDLSAGMGVSMGGNWTTIIKVMLGNLSDSSYPKCIRAEMASGNVLFTGCGYCNDTGAVTGVKLTFGTATGHIYLYGIKA